MRIIKIAANENGSHDNMQYGADVPTLDGWAVIPDDMAAPDTFPFVDVTAEDGIVTNLTACALPEPSVPMLTEVQSAKLAEINATCTAAIEAGCDVTLSDGTAGHISLTAEDQINLSTAQAAIQGGAAEYPYHLDGQLCKIFPASDILIMARAATAHILYHTTYCNHLHGWVSRCVAVSDVSGIAYGCDLPADLAANMQTILSAEGVQANA